MLAKVGSKLHLTVTQIGEPRIYPESVALVLPDHLSEFAWVAGCRRLPLGRKEVSEISDAAVGQRSSRV